VDLGLKGKAALVAASSRGLGKAVALGLAREGARVAICARNERDLLEAQREIEEKTGGRVIARAADVTNGDSVKSLVRDVFGEFAAVDILVCNAGGPPSGPIGDFGPDDYRKALELNLLSTIALCREVVPHMKERGWGRIVNVTSVSAKQPIDTLALSNTARAGVLGYSKTLSNQTAPFGITVNSVCPGYTKTERVEDLAKAYEESGKGDAQEFFRAVERTIPMGRLGRPEELAAAVVFLCSDAAGYITGVALQVDGGYVKSIY
jgi:3-oxoacyl-[acyl-carrier protein] reductase